jgi:hypothetical protein
MSTPFTNFATSREVVQDFGAFLKTFKIAGFFDFGYHFSPRGIQTE